MYRGVLYTVSIKTAILLIRLMLNTRYYMKKIHLIFVSVVLMAISSLSPLIASAQAEQSVDCATFEQWLSLNDDRGFNNPCVTSSCAAGSGSLDGPPPTKVTGESNPEKVWNYLIERGLSPVAAAGVLGNMEAESGFDPWVENNIGAFGIIQWLGGRADTVKSKLREAGVTEFTEANNDAGLLVELNWMWEEAPSQVPGEYPFWEKLNAETKVDGDLSIPGDGYVYSNGVKTGQVDLTLNATRNEGNGSTLLFHAVIERSSMEGMDNRLKSAAKYMELYGNGSTDSSGESSCGSVSEGGLTFEQAKALIDWYVEVGSGEITPGEIGSPLADGMGWSPGMGQCYAWSVFVTSYVLKGSFGFTSAEGAAQELINAANPGSTQWKEVSADQLQPFTAVSFQGHTGVIVGIQDGKLIYTDLNVEPGGAPLDTDTKYLRSNVGGSISSGRVMIVDGVDGILASNPPLVTSYPPFSAPVDMNTASQLMQEFFQSKGIGGS